MSEVSTIKKGYLEQEYRIFHIKDKKSIDFEPHYHDFNKIIIFISGEVTYLVEGKSYKLKPYDILFLSSGEVHKPIINENKVYERYIIWINEEFFEKHFEESGDLYDCFKLSAKEGVNLLRLRARMLDKLKGLLEELDTTTRSKEFGVNTLRKSMLLQILVYLNRFYVDRDKSLDLSNVEFDETIQSIINYINENICEDLSIEELAERFFLSKYHLMRKFKMATGYTVHNYILQKRLALAHHFIKKGESATYACINSGFNDYSNFTRAFKKKYGEFKKIKK